MACHPARSYDTPDHAAKGARNRRCSHIDVDNDRADRGMPRMRVSIAGPKITHLVVGIGTQVVGNSVINKLSARKNQC